MSESDKGGYSRVLLKLSGEALCSPSGHGVETVPSRTIAREIRAARETGVQMSIVVGGGNFIRGSVLERDGGFDRATTDAMGMLGTVINAIGLASILDAEGVRARALSAVESGTTCERYTRQRGKELMRAGEVVVIGGGTSNPYFTTDSAATLRAAELDCDAVIKATKVDGVYSDDPKTNPNATRYTDSDSTRRSTKGSRSWTPPPSPSPGQGAAHRRLRLLYARQHHPRDQGRGRRHHRLLKREDASDAHHNERNSAHRREGEVHRVPVVPPARADDDGREARRQDHPHQRHGPADPAADREQRGP